MRQLFSLEFPLVKSIFFRIKKLYLIILLNGYWVAAVLCYGSLNTRFKEFIWEISTIRESCHSWIDITGKSQEHKGMNESLCVEVISVYAQRFQGRIAWSLGLECIEIIEGIQKLPTPLTNNICFLIVIHL